MKSTRFTLLLITILFLSSSCTAQKELTNERIWSSNEFSSNSIYSVRSMNDGEHFSLLENNIINKYNYENFGEPVSVILNLNNLEFDGKSIKASNYFFNSDETKALIVTHKKSRYRRSYTAKHYVVDLKNQEVSKVSNYEFEELAHFSPDGNQVAFVFVNNIYINDLQKNVTTQITYDGKVNEIINGGTDWVYEEEFSITKGFYWSPDSKQIAYYTFDESNVREFTMPYYRGRTYPVLYTFKYPKAGEDNSILKVNIYNLKTKQSINCLTSSSKYEYFPRMKWTPSNDLCVLGMNRYQNKLDYIIIEGEQPTKQEVIYSDNSDTYVEVDDNLIFLKDDDSFLRTSEVDGYNHIYKIGFNGKIKQVTDGKWDVIDLKGIDEVNNKIYYTSVEEGAIYKAVYSIDIKGKNKVKLSKNKGYNSAKFSTGMKYYINYYSNANTPNLITLHQSNGKKLKTLEDNKDLRSNLKRIKPAVKKFITIKGASGNLNASVIKPADFDENKTYPVYFYIYNGPGSNVVKDVWSGSSYLYHQLLAQKGYIVISVDTRGTMYRGADFKKSTYLQLGKLETEDMIAVAKKVAKWPFVDKNRIGIQGWSYGGYMTALCMTKGADVFKMGIAVAPVTNWRWYDNIYTERFMRTPKENAGGYDDNSPINHVDKLKGKFLIVHGSGDDNVHHQNSMEMIDKMVANNIDFDMMMYPNKNHGIYGGKTRLHLYNKLLNYTLNNL